MTNEHRKQIDALIAALGELEEAKFDASLTPPLPDRRNPRFESADIHRQRFDNNRTLTDTKRAVLKAAANARPALEALVARVAELEAALGDIQKHIETTGGSGYARLSGTWNIAEKALNKGNSDA